MLQVKKIPHTYWMQQSREAQCANQFARCYYIATTWPAVVDIKPDLCKEAVACYHGTSVMNASCIQQLRREARHVIRLPVDVHWKMIMRMFGSAYCRMMTGLVTRGEVIHHSILTSLERATRKVRKTILEYQTPAWVDIMNNLGCYLYNPHAYLAIVWRGYESISERLKVLCHLLKADDFEGLMLYCQFYLTKLPKKFKGAAGLLAIILYRPCEILCVIKKTKNNSSCIKNSHTQGVM